MRKAIVALVACLAIFSADAAAAQVPNASNTLAVQTLEQANELMKSWAQARRAPNDGVRMELARRARGRIIQQDGPRLEDTVIVRWLREAHAFIRVADAFLICLQRHL